MSKKTSLLIHNISKNLKHNERLEIYQTGLTLYSLDGETEIDFSSIGEFFDYIKSHRIERIVE